MKRTLRWVEPLQLGKLVGVLYAGMSIVMFPIFALMAGISLFTAPQGAGSAPAWVAAAIMLAFGLVAPVFYGAMGFAIGLVGAWLYNLAARYVGGIRFEVE